MFDIGLPEMLVVVVVTLLVVGPKDLPRVIRSIASMMARIRALVAEFRSGVNDFVRESELADLQDAIDKTRAAMDDPNAFADFVDPTTGKPLNPDGSAVKEPPIADAENKPVDENTDQQEPPEEPSSPKEPSSTKGNGHD